MCSLHDRHIQDVVLGLRVTSTLTDPMTVLSTVSQNRFLLGDAADAIRFWPGRGLNSGLGSATTAPS